MIPETTDSLTLELYSIPNAFPLVHGIANAVTRVIFKTPSSPNVLQWFPRPPYSMDLQMPEMLGIHNVLTWFV